MTADFLQSVAGASRRRVEAARRRVADDILLERAHRTPTPPGLVLHERFDLIAEIKLRSPATGPTGTLGEDLISRVQAYAGGGAAAISVLTEPSRFDGSLYHLAAAASSLRARRLPTMRKDFLVDPYQLVEARLAGAAGALLILRLLRRSELESLVGVARGLELFLLLEAFDEQDLRQARSLIDAVGSEGLLVGVNSRDLSNLRVVPDRLVALANHLPEGVPCVAESGLVTPDDMRTLARAGYRLALVGTALMQAQDPGALIQRMLEGGRAA